MSFFAHFNLEFCEALFCYTYILLTNFNLNLDSENMISLPAYFEFCFLNHLDEESHRLEKMLIDLFKFVCYKTFQRDSFVICEPSSTHL